MKNKTRLLISTLLFILAYLPQSNAQVKTHSPELAQMYGHALEFIAAKNYQSAIIILKQEITLEPENILLPEQMGKALLLNGQTKEAITTLKETIGKANADTDAYHFLIQAYISNDELKAALKIADMGLSKFPTAGLLQNDKGKIFALKGNDEQALNCYLNGFVNNNSLAENYKDASQIYFMYNNILPGAIYLEIYLNLAHDTTYDDTLKYQLYMGWKNICEQNIPDKYNKSDLSDESSPVPNFQKAITNELFELSPTTSDGISTENLTMLRTRFVMNYIRKHHSTNLSFQLFEWQNELIKNGKFDIYNEWLFGKAESEVGYNAWNTFHDGDINRFMSWKVSHPYKPETLSKFITSDFGDLFKKPKKGKNK